MEIAGRAEPREGLVVGNGDRAESWPRFDAPRGIEPSDVVEAFADASAVVGQVLSAHLWIEDPDSATLRIVAAAGELKPASEPVPIDQGALGAAVLTQAARLTLEPGASLSEGHPAVWRFAVPLSGAGLRGVAATDIVCDDPDRELLARIGAHYRPLLASSMRSHAAHEESKAATEMIGAVRELSRMADPQKLVEMLLTRAMHLAQATTGSVMLLGDDRMLTIACAEGLSAEIVDSARLSEGDGIAGWVLATGKPVVIEDLVGKPLGRRPDVRASMSVPIADDDGIVGVLNVGAPAPRAWARSSVADALESLGRIGGIALRTARAHQESRDLYVETVRALARAVEAHNPTAPVSAERLLTLVTGLAQACSLENRDIEALRVATLMRDIGMPGSGASGLQDDRPLTTVEWGLVKLHPMIAAHTLAQVPSLRGAIPFVLHHHERFDGTGYVDGISGADIPRGARVLSVADAFVAMTSPRTYRGVMTPAEAVARIREHAGSQFDPEVVELFAKASDDGESWLGIGG